MTWHGYNVTFSKDQCKVITPRQGGVITIPNNNAGLNHLHATVLKGAPVNDGVSAILTRKAEDINNVHVKLGHASEKYIRATYKAAGRKLRGEL